MKLDVRKINLVINLWGLRCILSSINSFVEAKNENKHIVDDIIIYTYLEQDRNISSFYTSFSKV